MSTTVAASTPGKALHIGLWVVQVLLALLFTMVGAMKLTAPIADLSAQMAWVSRYSPEAVRFIGVSEVLGGLGLILPAATRIRPSLTGWAAVGLFIIMVLAGVHHLQHGESIVPNLVLGALSAFVAWGRLKGAPIAPRA